MTWLWSKCCQNWNCILIISLFASTHILSMVKWDLNSLQLSTHFQRLVMWFPAFFSGYFLSCFSSSSSSSCLVSPTSHAEPKSVRHLLCSVPKITWGAVDTTPAQQLVWTGSCWKVQLPAARTPRSFLLKINSWDADTRPHGAELISPQSPEELNTVRNYQPPFSEVRAWFQGQQMPSDCWAQTSSFSAQDFGRLLYHALCNFSVSSDQVNLHPYLTGTWNYKANLGWTRKSRNL